MRCGLANGANGANSARRGPRAARLARRRGFSAAAVAASAAMATIACSGDWEIEKPTPLFTASPVEYPLELWDQDVEGSTLVRVLVNEEGGVDSVTVVESSGHTALDSAAVRGAMAMEFEPARKRGEPLRVWARVPVHFSKSGTPPAIRPPGEEGEAGAPAPSATDPNVTSGSGE